ncbi:sugar phosphate isomerase/epimerase [bacterium]|nr:MAG: sugar phosphate isomerase/epimerase [bacterium]MCL4230849.1 sugar phosphate isomerase/epimerase [Dehalococcoidia bacterium]
MKALALSTMFAQQDRFAHGGDFARFAAEAGYDSIEVSHSTREETLRQVLEANVLPVTSVHQPAPWVQHHDGRGNSHLNLASTDPGERRAAVDYARASIEWAGRIGASSVVVHLGQVTGLPAMFPEEHRLRRLIDSGIADDAQAAALRHAAIAARRSEAEPHLAAARASLLELVRAAEPWRIALGLENRYHFHEIPLPHEYDQLLAGLVPAQAGYWHDMGHAEVLHRLGFVDRHAWFAANGRRTIGAHIHDVSGIGDHRAPGRGDVDWEYIVAGLGHLPRYTLEINQHEPDEGVRGVRAFLTRVGLV